MKFADFLRMFIQFLPVVIELVQQVEVVMGPGKGPDKLHMAVGTMTAAVAASPTEMKATEGFDLTAGLTGLVNVAVAGAKAAGKI